MPKKLVTVAWSYTVEVETEQNLDVDSLNDWNPTPEIALVARNAVEQAFKLIGEKDGVITDVQEA